MNYTKSRNILDNYAIILPSKCLPFTLYNNFPLLIRILNLIFENYLALPGWLPGTAWLLTRRFHSFVRWNIIGARISKPLLLDRSVSNIP